MPSEADVRSELVKMMFDLRSARFGRCLATEPLCPNPAINAHSVQNSGVLDLLVKDGHVVAPTLRLNAPPKPPAFELGSVGRNKATTFLGLCETHDRELFRPIEVAPIDLANPEHLFLLAYRAVNFGVHATAAAAWRVQLGYQKRVELGIDPKGQPSPGGMLAVGRIAVAYDTYCFKQQFDEVRRTSDFSRVSHDVFLHTVERPTVAACVLFSLDHHRSGADVVRVCLNIFPTGPAETAIVLSYMATDAAVARAELISVLDSVGPARLYHVSRRLLNHGENFVLAPDFVASWSDSKRRTILEYFKHTLLKNDLDFEHPDLYLF